MGTAGCAACGGVAASLSRCGRCKWVAYCSKACQLAHWKDGGHRSLCAALMKAGAFRAHEERFWQSRSQEELRQFSQLEGMDPASMRFYGEVLFLLVGLKPCVLFSNIPINWRQSFISNVVIPSAVGIAPHPPSCSPKLFEIVGNLQTPAEYPLQHTLLLVNTAHSACKNIEAVLHLRLVSPDTPTLSLPEHVTGVQLVQESLLARVLDYPIALDECVDPMIEVGYFLVLPDDSRQLLLSYCASALPPHEARIRAHFRQYQQRFGVGTLRLAIDTSRLS